MSRAGRRQKPISPPPKPESVQRVERELRWQRESLLVGACRVMAWQGRFPLWRSPEGHGAEIANLMMAQALERLRRDESKIVMPQPGMLLPR